MERDGELEELALATVLQSGFGVYGCLSLTEQGDVELLKLRQGRLDGG